MTGPPTRTCCLWCPDWPVAVARRADRGLASAPVAVLGPGPRGPVVRAASVEARAEGVAPGLRRREAEARCDGLAVVEVAAGAEARAFEAVVRAVEVLTPRLELEVPGRLVFPTRGPSRYFGGDPALAERVRAEVASVGVGGARVGVADGVFAARLAARAAGRAGVHVVPPGGTPGFLAPWPVDALGLPELADLLVRLGLRTLGELAALPAPAVLARFGVEGSRAHRRALGVDDRPPHAAAPAPELVEEHGFDPPAARVDVAAFVAKGLADRLLDRLAAHGWTATLVAVEAETEHGERWSRRWRHEGALTAAALAERVRWQLEGWLAAGGGAPGDDPLVDAEVPTGGLTLLRLVPEEVVPAGGRQLGFWGGDAAAADRAARVLARVQGMLGPDAVVAPVLRGGRTPDERVRWIPWGEAPPPAGPGDPGSREVAPWPGAVPGPAPARVHVPGAPAELVDAAGRAVTVSARGDVSGVPAGLRCAALPGGGGEVVAWTGPFAHDLRWWDPPARRRRVLWQVVLRGGAACLVAVERGRAAVEAVWD